MGCSSSGHLPGRECRGQEHGSRPKERQRHEATNVFRKENSATHSNPLFRLPLPCGEGWGGGKCILKYRDPEQRDCARQLRNQPMDPEKRLWWFLRAEKMGCKFRRQAAIGSYIVDFVCFAKNLVIELDGPQHLETEAKEHDANRT